VKVGWTQHCCYKIKVVDGPDLTKVDLRTTDGTDNIFTNMVRTLFLCNGGVDVFLLVIKLGDRFTPEMKETISDLEKIFGEDYLKERGIIVVTGGDYFKAAMKNEGTPGTTFNEWVHKEEQHEDFKKLVEECSSRIVLFNNFPEEEEEITEQIDDLFKLAEELRKNELYTSDHFKIYKHMRQELINKKILPLLQEEFQRKINLLLDEVEKCSSHSLPLEDDYKRLLLSLESKVKALLSDIKNEEKMNEKMNEKLKPLNDVLLNLQDFAAKLQSDVKENTPKTTALAIQAFRRHGENLKKCGEIAWEEMSCKRACSLGSQSKISDMASALIAHASSYLEAAPESTTPVTNHGVQVRKDNTKNQPHKKQSCKGSEAHNSKKNQKQREPTDWNGDASGDFPHTWI
jgi:hypothetical protein